MLMEMHAHTSRHSSCSAVDPVLLVRLVAAKGLQGVVITEHHYLWTPDELAQLRVDAGVGAHFRMFAAQEVGTDLGHVLVYGADETIPDTVPLARLRAQYPAASLVWAHPYRKGRVPERSELLNPLLDGIEILSLNHTMRENYAGLRDWHRYKFTALCGSDTHTQENAGVFPSQFDHDADTIEELAAEIKARRCRPFIKEIPRAGSGQVVTEVTIGTKGPDEQRHRLIIRQYTDDRKWERVKETARLTERLHAGGFSAGMFRVPRVIEVNDEEKLFIEEGQRGKDLFDTLSTVAPKTGVACLELSARWLARLHALPPGPIDTAAVLAREEKRFASYARAFASTSNPHTATARRMIEAVSAYETAAVREHAGAFVLCHGDFHPKNIIIGQDRMQDPDTRFVSVIDFEKHIAFLPAFDVGYFLAQYDNQYAGLPDIRARYTPAVFLDAYRSAAGSVGPDFERQVALSALRGNLSIAGYLIKVGKGESPEMDAVMERSQSLLAQTA